MRLYGLGSIDTVAQAIQQQEGFYAGTLAWINNNPGNLIPAGQSGCTPGAGGFCSFPAYEQGYQALLNQISLDASRGYTILQFTTKYLGGDPNNPGTAPGGDPNVYARNLAAATGLSVDDPLSAAVNVYMAGEWTEAGGGSSAVPIASDNTALIGLGLALLVILAASA